MGVIVQFQTSGIIGVTELFTQTITDNATLTSSNPDDATSYAIAVVLAGTGDVQSFTVTLPEPTVALQPNIKVGSVIKFKYLAAQLEDAMDNLLYYPDEAARDNRDLTGLVTTVNDFPAYPVITIDDRGAGFDGQTTDDIIVNVPNQSFEIIYHGGSLGWVVY